MEKTGLENTVEKAAEETRRRTFMEEAIEQEVIRLVKERMPKIHMETVEIEKNNGLRKRGFQIYGEDDSKRMIIYQQEMIRACGASCTVREAADYLCQVMDREKPVLFHKEMFCDWDRV